VTSSAIDITAGAATQLTITTPPSTTAQSGVAFAQQPAIQLRDVSGNLVSQAGVVVTAAIATGGGTLGGTATASTTASGLATFTNLSITGTIGQRTLSFSATGLGTVTSSAIDITAGAPTQLTITTPPSATAQSGVAFAQQPAIQLRDVSGNLVSQAGVVVTAAIATGGGTLGGTATASTTASGLATFANLSITGTIGQRTLSFSATGLGTVTSSAIDITAGAATQLTITTPPSATAQNGVAFAQQPAIQLRDVSGNAVSQAGVVVTAAIATGGGTLDGTTTATTGGTGLATFANLGITGTVGDRTLRFTATGLTDVVSGTITITAGSFSATQSTVEAAPSTILAVTETSTITVTVKDASGNPIAGVTVVLDATGTGNSLTQPSGTTNASGVATGSLSSIVAETKTVSATVNSVAITQTATVTVQAFP
jgi:uncharacterized protein YccT (UPF0319 family)